MGIELQSKLGEFQILDRLGAGAMGVVYRAQDLRLDRQVAIKVLPDVLADDAQRLARFKREAKLLASLNHVNIASIYELGNVDNTHFLVMELIDGTTLAQLLDRSALPPEKALPMFAQIADALEYAHEHGVIHRDLKPANVMVTDQGIVKVLDFGLAKVFQEPTTSSGETVTRDEDSAVVSGEGQVLGTPAYMSPEQASGKKLDKRTDIWAFGCCLYEALGGRRPFVGENATQLLARILERDPDWEALNSEVPARVRVLIWRCLQKDPRRRLRDIGEARFELGDSALESSDAIAAISFKSSQSGGERTKHLLWGVLGVLLGAILAAPILMLLPREAIRVPVVAEGRVERSVFRVEDGAVRALHVLNHLGIRVTAIAISPDGRWIAYVAETEDGHQLYLRDRTRFDGVPVPGTDGAFMPFFSPDGNTIAYFTQSELKTVPVSGGIPRTICPAPNPVGGCWGENDTIYFAAEEGKSIRSVSADGSDERLLLDRPLPVFAPQLLPEGKGIIATGFFETKKFNSHDYGRIIYFPLDASGELREQDSRVILKNGYLASYVSSGHLVFMRGDSLMAVAIDQEDLRIDGQPREVVSEVMAPQFTVSAGGDLAYVHGKGNWKSRPEWIDREGTEVEIGIQLDPLNAC